ncbi:hypothetical protein SAY86_030020 [Trapa natans]|uniref:Uncharacterized protein n=1 Tax=Trapa natans TaxID=22666 RepID=A0AAN7M344_TRANT|nr:hypothetical protein SAY86_030020 [Trapa natans]
MRAIYLIPCHSTHEDRKLFSWEKAGMDEIRTAESLQCDFATIRDSTDNFSEENKLGQGGFGPVYKAWRNWIEGTATSIVDPSLINNGPRTEILRCIHIGLLCVQENADWEGRVTVGMSSSVTASIREIVRNMATGKIRTHDKADRAMVELV